MTMSTEIYADGKGKRAREKDETNKKAAASLLI